MGKSSLGSSPCRHWSPGKILQSCNLTVFSFFTKEDVEEGAESVQATVSSRTSNVSTVNEEDNRSETASSGYASVQGADESVLEEHAPSESMSTVPSVVLDCIALHCLCCELGGVALITSHSA